MADEETIEKEEKPEETELTEEKPEETELTEEKPEETITKDPNLQNEKPNLEIVPEKADTKTGSNAKTEDSKPIVNGVKESITSLEHRILSIGKKAQEIRGKAEETFTVGSKRDARDIQALGKYAKTIIKDFEKMMAEAKKRNYADEEKLLIGYMKLLEEQINIINARVRLVKKLKSE